jgi:glutamate-5-semialdehyde dehydrogenase
MTGAAESGAVALKDDLAADMAALGRAARAAASELALTGSETKARALEAAAAVIRERQAAILEANQRDMAAARAKGLAPAMLDRLELNPERVEAMAEGLEQIAAFPDPVGRTLGEWERPNGLKIARVAVPLGVIAIIYESRPNVTADAGGLCLKAGNAAILRGGSESFHSSGTILESDRAAVGILLTMSEFVDVIVPRGGRGLIERIFAESKIPVLAHLEGLCHTYVDRAADLDMARTVVLNAKMRRTGICGATETLLVDRQVAASHLPAITEDLAAAGCELRGDEAAQALDSRISPAGSDDWDTEYLAPILSIKVVDGVDDAMVDAGIVMHNTSTQFADGGEFGMGAEIGISTGKLHARGPVGAEQLTSYKYVVRGAGQARP